MRFYSIRFDSFLRSVGTSITCGLVAGGLVGSIQQSVATPKVIVVSLDGATPRFVEKYLANGILPPDRGIGLLKHKGVHAERNFTVSPSLTAVGHIAIATGSTAAHNDIAANTFHLVASPFLTTISGFGAPIGGYQIAGPAMRPVPISTSELNRWKRCITSISHPRLNESWE
jgi:Uncharacterized proteins of the AP superfamily